MIESEIENDIGQLLGALHKAGYRVDSTRYDAAAFGNWWVELSGPTSFSVFKDRGQYMVEEAFKRMKDPHHIALRPQHHWTDQKVEVHVFCCVLALTLCSLLRRELSQKGIDRSIPAILDDLSRIQEVAVVYPAKSKGGEPGIKVTLSNLSDDQRALYEALDLARYRTA